MKIVADSAIPFLRGVLEPWAAVEYIPGAEMGPAVVAEADALIVRTRTRCDGRLLGGSRVKMVATATIGTDHIDLGWCRSHGIEVASAAGCNARGVLQWVAAVLAMLAGGPRGLTLGVVGAGHVGELVRRYASSWGFRVVCSDPPRERAEGLGRAEGFVPFGELAAASDIVTFHVPMVRGGEYPTLRMAGGEFFDALPRGALVINSSRGGVVDTEALRGALRRGRCRAALDVWEGEPHIDPEVLALASVATPHIAGYSLQGKAAATAMAVEALARRFGLPLGGWYPPGVPRSVPRDISWEELKSSAPSRTGLAEATRRLKDNPAGFEAMRNGYDYREEYF